MTLANSLFKYIFVLAFTLSCSQNNKYITLDGDTMGTTYIIKYSKNAISENKLKLGVNNILKNINTQMSTYDLDSEISSFNDMPADSSIKISDDFYYVLEKSKYYYDISNSQFDITVNSLSAIWGFNNRVFTKPSDKLINTTLNIVGFDKIELLDDNRISKKNSELEISLNAIAKGYALDKISQYFDNNGIENYMIEIGGEVKVKGENPNKQDWVIAISSPDSRNEDYLKFIHLKQGAMATSGDYRNFMIHDSVSYSHIINPKTGYPTTNNVVSATVIADNCIDADALATILNIMDINKGIQLINRLDKVECFIVERIGEKFNYYYSENMEKYIN